MTRQCHNNVKAGSFNVHYNDDISLSETRLLRFKMDSITNIAIYKNY